jgi:hypothetical protein
MTEVPVSSSMLRHLSMVSRSRRLAPRNARPEFNAGLISAMVTVHRSSVGVTRIAAPEFPTWPSISLPSDLPNTISAGARPLSSAVASKIK